VGVLRKSFGVRAREQRGEDLRSWICLPVAEWWLTRRQAALPVGEGAEEEHGGRERGEFERAAGRQPAHGHPCVPKVGAFLEASNYVKVLKESQKLRAAPEYFDFLTTLPQQRQQQQLHQQTPVPGWLNFPLNLSLPSDG
jgi:hypothetical protein